VLELNMVEGHGVHPIKRWEPDYGTTSSWDEPR
jgi:hypothetical protein